MRSKNERTKMQAIINESPQFSKRIQSLINHQSSLQSPQPSPILTQIQQFHEYYNSRYQQLKTDCDKISKQNREYAGKLLQYEQKFEQYQQTLYFVNKKAQTLEIQVQNLSGKNGKTTIFKEYEEILQAKDLEIQNLKQKIRELASNKESNDRHTIIKRYKISSISNTPRPSTALPQRKEEGIKNCESTRIQYKMSAMQEENQQLIHENSQYLKQIESMRKRIKNLQANKKYEDQRLKSATLALELDLQMKNQQILRLNSQMQIYQRKFSEAVSAIADNGHKKNKTHKICNNQNIPTINLMMRNENHQQSRVELDEQNTNPSISNYPQTVLNDEPQEKTEKKYEICQQLNKGRHKRNFSANLQNYDPKDKIDLKVKVLRFDKNKRKY